MTIVEQLKEIVESKIGQLDRDGELQKLSDFYERKKKEGAVKKPRYTLPQLDTIGRDLIRKRRAKNAPGG